MPNPLIDTDTTQIVPKETTQQSYNPLLTAQIDKTDRPLQSYGNANDDPLHGNPLYTPNPNYNVTDEEHINRDTEVLNTGWNNFWNDTKASFWDAMLTTNRGKMVVGASAGVIPWKDYEGPEAIVDMYPDKLAELDKQLASKTIDPVEYNTRKKELDDQKAAAEPILQSYKDDIANDQAHIDANPVSKQYKLNQMLVAGQGDDASYWNKFKYGTSSNVGSSVGFMAPAIAASFGNKLVQNLSKTAILNVFPEAGVPADIIGGLVAFGAAVGETIMQRNLESYAEIDKPIQDMRAKLTAQYIEDFNSKNPDNRIFSPDQIPEDDMRKIRNQSRQGAEQQFRENSMLGATDFAQALLIPGSNIGYGLGKYLGFASNTLNMTEKLAEEAAQYGKYAKVASKIATGYIETEIGGYEMGFRTAAQARATEADQKPMSKDEQADYNKFSKMLAWTMQDGYDVATSMDIIPNVSGSNLGGKYSKDKEFQESVWGGQFLAGIMVGPMTAFSVSKDMLAYRAANNDLQTNALVDIDGKYKRVQNDIMIKYFNKGEAGIDALVNAVKAQTSGDDPIITKEQANETVDNIHKVYDVYKGVSNRVDNITNDATSNGILDRGKKFVFGDKEFEIAKTKLKMDYVSELMNLQDKKSEEAQLELKKQEQFSKEAQIWDVQDPGTLEAIHDIQARQESIERLRKEYESFRGNPIFKLFPSDRSKALDRMEDEMIEQSKQLDEHSQANENRVPISPVLAATMDKLNANQLFQREIAERLDELSKIKTKSDLLAYTQKNVNRPVPPNSDLNPDKDATANTAENMAPSEEPNIPESYPRTPDPKPETVEVQPA